MNKEHCFELGYITKTHGIKGNVLMYLDVDHPEDYASIEMVLIETPSGIIPKEITHFNLVPNKKKTAIVTLEGVNHIDKAEEWIGCSLYLPLDILPKLGDTTFYYHEIINFQVFEKDVLIGVVKEVYDFEKNSILVVIHDATKEEVLIPISDETILKVDRTLKKIDASLPEGLLELYTQKD